MDSLVPSNNGSSTCVPVGNHRLEINQTESGAVIRLLGPNGTRPVEIDITPSGPVLRLGTGLSIVVDGPLAIAGEVVDIRATKSLSLYSDGDIKLSAAHAVASEAAEHTIVARDRNITLDANDDVAINGERIRLNG